MFAIELSASSFCARDMRGTQSIASTVALRALRRFIRSGFCAGQTKQISSRAFAQQFGFVNAEPHVRLRRAHFEHDVGDAAHSARAFGTISAPACR